MQKVYFKLYKEDGSAISNGDMSNPLSVLLNASENEEAVLTTKLKPEEGYKLNNVEVKVGHEGDEGFVEAEKYFVSLDNSTWTKSVVIDEEVTEEATIYVKVVSSDDEEPGKDETEKINIKASVQVV